MATRDVMPLTSSQGGHNRIRSFERESSATYLVGEWVDLTGSPGVINELAGSAPGFDPDTHFIAAESATVRVDRVGDDRYTDGPNVAKLDAVYVIDKDTEFVTLNAFSGSDSAVLVSTAVVGGNCGPRVTSGGVHGVDIGDAGFAIVRLLDANGKDSALSGQTATQLVFTQDV